jgi:hypothetical protein
MEIFLGVLSYVDFHNIMNSTVKLIVGYKRYRCHDKNVLASSSQDHNVGHLRLRISSTSIALNHRGVRRGNNHLRRQYRSHAVITAASTGGC